MEVINTIKLEDNQNYMIIDEITFSNIKYIYLTNLLDSEDFCIRKLVNTDLCGLNDEKEFNQALELFKKKRGN